MTANPRSRERFADAAKYIPGGNTRLALYYDPFPLFFKRTWDGRVQDVDEHEYVDFSNDFTAALYGHSNRAIVEALTAALHQGLNFGGSHDHEVRYAAEICRRFRSIERVKFCTSGAEANLGAMLMARAVTGRSLVLAFRGGFHGNVVNYLNPGSDMNVEKDRVVLARFNDLDSVDDLADRHGTDIAAIIVEPVMGSAGGITGETGFLRGLRQVADRIGAILIFDEVQTARFAPGGYQSVIDVYPDVTTLGKFFGGGLNFGAIGGRADLIDRFSPLAPDLLFHGGTFNNNVLTMIAGYVGLTEVLTPQALDTLHATSDRLRTRLAEIARKRSVPLTLGSYGSLIATHYQETLPRNPEEIQTPPPFRKLYQLFMINHGVFVNRRGTFNVSLANTAQDCALVTDLFDAFLATYGHLVQGERPGEASLRS